jgi:uncharacterized membrane protein
VDSTTERRITRFFKVSVLIKSIQGLLEVIGGILLLLTNIKTITLFITQYTNPELIENSNDIISISLNNIAQHLSSSGKTFVAFYLFSHGLIKLFLIIGLLKKRIKAYYAFIIILGSFIIYQIYRYVTMPSLILLIFTLFDILLVWLAWQESKILKKHLRGKLKKYSKKEIQKII